VVPNERRIHFPPFALDLVNECLWHDSRPIKLRPKAFAVLELLLARAGELVTKEHLIRAVWQDAFVGDAVLKVAVRQIREALSDDPRSPRFIETSHRRGYRFIGPITAGVETAALSHQSPGAVTTSAHARLTELPAGFVGREGALSRMHALLDKASAGECQVVFVTGEAGIGKTTLLETFARTIAANASIRICNGQCLEQYGMIEAFLPVLDAIRQLCRQDATVVDVLRAHAPMWLMQMPSLVTSADRDLFGRETAAVTRERMLREMGEVLEALTEHSVLVLVLEDLHWSDFSTLDLISYIARRLRTAHLMMVGTYRPAELIARHHPLKAVKQELAARQQCQELALEYLTREAVGQHIDVRFSGNRFPAELATLIHDRTEGNPLFMVNTIDHLVAEGLAEPHADGWRLTAALDSVKVGVPDSIRQLIETQVDRLAVRDQRLLEAASVAGPEFPTVAVSAALDDGLEDVQARCEELSVRRQFIRECGVQLLPNGQTVGRFGFVHDMYRHVLYNRVPASRRVQLHQRVGRRYEELYGARASEIAAELAMHFEQAGEYEPAVRHLHEAAVNATLRSAYREAITVSRMGLKLLATLPETDDRARQELQFQITLGVPLIATEGYAAPQVGTVYRRARRLCERFGTMPQAAQVLWGLWTFHMLKAELATASGFAGELLQLAQRESSPGVAMRGHWTTEISSTHQGDFRLALSHFERALAHYQPDRVSDELFADVLNPGVAVRCFAGWSLWCIGQPDRAVAQIQDAVALARHLPEPHGLAHALAFAAVLHQLRREKSVALVYADEAVNLAAEYELVFYGAMAQIVRGWALIGTVDNRQAAEQIRNGLAAWHSTGARLMRPHFLALLAEVDETQESDEGLRLLDEALALVQSTGERMYEAELHRLRGERLLNDARGGATDAAAEECFEQSLTIARRQEALSLELRTALSLARLHLGRQRHAQALDVIRPVYERFDEGFATPDLTEARSLLDMLATVP